MRKHAERFHANKGYKLVIAVFIPTSLFSKQTFVVRFSNIIYTKSLAHPYFLYHFESLCLSYVERQMVPYLVIKVQFYQRDRFLGVDFFSGPGSWSGSSCQTRLFVKKKKLEILVSNFVFTPVKLSSYKKKIFF